MVAATLACCFAGAASAITVQYSTSGVFASTSTAVSSGGSLSFIGLLNNVVTEPTIASLGDFKASGTLETFVNEGFTLMISQVLPGSGNGQLLGSLSGTLNTTQSGLVVTFSTPSTTISSVGQPNVIYSLFPNAIVGIAPSSTNGGVTTVEANIAAVPLPATANMGLILLGSVAGLGLVRRLRNGPAVVA